MSKTLQFRRYPTSNLASITGASGELIVDTTLNQITVHDGSTAGGWYAANNTTLQLVWNTANAAYAQSNTDLTYLAANVANLLGIDTSQNSTVNLAFSAANSAGAYANAAFLVANTTSNTATAAFVEANAAFAAANAAATLIPQNPESNNYVLQLSDAGKHIYYTNSSNVNLYIPTTSNVAFSNGSTIMIVSHTTTGNVTVTPNTGVSLFAAGNSTSGSHNVTSYGVVTLMTTAANTWYIYGTGLN